jgi:hypothetical protein
VHADATPAPRENAGNDVFPKEQAAGLSKLNSEQNVRGRRDLGELE